MTLEPKERSVTIAEYRAGKPQLMLASWTPDFLDPDPWADAFYGGGPAPKRVNYDNPKVTDLIATAKTTLDPKKREALYKEINKIALEDVPFDHADPAQVLRRAQSRPSRATPSIRSGSSRWRSSAAERA